MAINAPEGTRDLLPDEAAFWTGFKQLATDTFGLYGYKPIETPVIEQTELFVRGIGEATDVVGKEMFSAVSGGNMAKLMAGEHIRSKSRLSLRPEGTAGTVRAVVEHDLVPQGAAPVKLVYAGPMFRAERPQHGRQRQFNQIGIECLGAEDPTVDAEGIIMLMEFFRELGIPQDKMTLYVNSMGCKSCRPAYRQLVRDYLLAHADQLCDDCRRRADTNPLRAFDCKEEACAAIMADAPKITDHLCDDCRAHYDQVKGYLAATGLAFEEDPTLVRGLDYYTRTVFEVQVPLGAEGKPSALGGGGRYDGLMEEVGGRPTPGFGFALGYERCVLALQESGIGFAPLPGPQVFVACVEPAQRPHAFRLVQALRAEGVSADMDHQNRSLKSQFKLANKLQAAFVATLGPDEVASGSATLRNMATHEEAPIRLDDPASVLPLLL